MWRMLSAINMDCNGVNIIGLFTLADDGWLWVDLLTQASTSSELLKNETIYGENI